jgi:hypothetical protein
MSVNLFLGGDLTIPRVQTVGRDCLRRSAGHVETNPLALLVVDLNREHDANFVIMTSLYLVIAETFRSATRNDMVENIKGRVNRFLACSTHINLISHPCPPLRNMALDRPRLTRHIQI